jgi:hypothetical protein
MYKICLTGFAHCAIISLLNCVEEGTTMVTSLVDGSLSEGQSRSFYNPSTRSKLKSFEYMTHQTKLKCRSGRETIMLESDQLEKTRPFQQ